MNNNYCITISRQFGSNGRHIGMALAKELGIAFYDKELIKLAAKESGVSEDMFEKADEMPSNSFLYSLSMGTRGYSSGFSYTDCLTNDKLFLMQSQVIKKVANEGPCVIVGRCADYILRDKENCFNVFIHANDGYRIKHVMGENNCDAAEAEEMIRKIGKKRASYYNYYSDLEWGDARNYDLSLDVSDITTEEAVKILKTYLEIVNK